MRSIGRFNDFRNRRAHFERLESRRLLAIDIAALVPDFGYESEYLAAEGEQGPLLNFKYKLQSASGASLDPNPNDSIVEYQAKVGEIVTLQVTAQDLRTNPGGVYSTYHHVQLVNQDGSADEILGLRYSETVRLVVGGHQAPVAQGTYKLQFGEGATAKTTAAITHPWADGAWTPLDILRITNAVTQLYPASGKPDDPSVLVEYLGNFGGGTQFNIKFVGSQHERLNIPNVTVVENNTSDQNGNPFNITATSYDPSPSDASSVRGALRYGENGWGLGVNSCAYWGGVATVLWQPLANGSRLSNSGGTSGCFSPPASGVIYEASFKVMREGTVNLSGVFISDTNAFPNLLMGTDNALTASEVTFPLNIPFTAIIPGSDRFEVNNSRQTATNLGTVNGQLVEENLSVHTSTDQDWYRYSTIAASGESHYVSINFEHSQGDLDLELYDSAGSLIAFSRTAANEERISLVGLPADSYFFRVSGFSNAVNPNYRLLLQTPTNSIPADRYEPNNSLVISSALGTVTTPKQFSNLTVHNSSDVDFYDFQIDATGAEGDYVQIDFMHTSGDLELRLLDSLGQTLATSATANNFERISLQGRSAGKYYLQVLGEDSAVNPNYSITIDPPTAVIDPDRFEPNNTITTATNLTVNEVFSQIKNLTVHQVTDNDWYKFDLQKEGRDGHYITVDFKHSIGDLDLELYSDAGVLLRTSSTSRDQERISLAGLSPGLYYFRVLGINSATQPDYGISLSVPLNSINPDSYEVNDQRSAAYKLRAIQGSFEVNSLTIHNNSDEDWFQFQSLSTGTLGHFVGLLYRTGEGDVDLQLYDSQGSLLDQSNLNDVWELISFSERPAGTYYIRVFSSEGLSNGSYSLGFSLPDGMLPPDRFEQNQVIETASNLKTLSGDVAFNDLSIHNGSDVDWLRFTTVATGDETSYIELRSSTSRGNIEAELRDRNGTILGRTSGTSEFERISLRGRVAGEYYLRIYGVEEALSQYDVYFQVPKSSIPADIYEPNNQLSQAYNLRTIEGTRLVENCTLHQIGDKDWFRFQLVSSANSEHYVSVDFKHSQGDVDLELYDDQGRLLRSSTTAFTPELISLAGLSAGTYYVRVLGYQDATSPKYDIQFVAPYSNNLQPDRYESNNSIATATRIRNEGNNLAGSLDTDSLTIHSLVDQDYFRFTTVNVATAAHSVSIDFNPGDGDLDLVLMNSSGVVIRQSEQSNATEFISLVGLPAAEYLVSVRGKPGATNTYRLRLDTPLSAGAVDNWTIMVYMTGSDLEQYAFEDINELEAAAQKIGGGVNFAVLWDQSEARTKYPSGNDSQPAWGSTGRGFIQPDRNENKVASNFELLGEQNTGLGSSITSFVEWAVAAAPASNYALIAWDHGAGIFGSNYDYFDNQPFDHLTASELRQALASSSVPQLQILAFDACLMAMTEVGHGLRNAADILVASQEVVGAEGYNYKTLFSTLVDNAAASPSQVASGMVRSYQNSYSSNTNGWNTQSAVNLSRLEAVANSLKGFTDASLSLSAAQWRSLSKCFETAIGYADPDFRDLGSAMRAVIADTSLTTDLRSAAQTVLNSLNESIISLSNDSRNSSGLSIFAPKTTREIPFFGGEFSEFDAATGWGNFLRKLATGGSGGSNGGGRFGRFATTRDWAESNDSFSSATNLYEVSGSNFSYSGLSLHDSSDVDWFRFSIGAVGTNQHFVELSQNGQTHISLKLYDSTAKNLIREVESSGDFDLSLGGIASGDYLLKVVSTEAATVNDYSLTFNVPDATLVDRTGSNATIERAFPLGLVTEQLVVNGLLLAAQQQEWLRFSSPKLPEPQWFSIQIGLGGSVQAEAVVRDASGNIVSRTSGNGELLLTYRAPGDGSSFYLQVISLGNQNTPYSLRLASLVATFPDVAVSENLAGVLIDALPLTELVSSVGTVTVSDSRFVWKNNQLLLDSSVYFNKTEQLNTQVEIEVTDAIDPSNVVSFILPIELKSNPSPWHNDKQRYNTNFDIGSGGEQLVNAIDALVIINRLNRDPERKLPVFRISSPEQTEFQFDVNNDGFVNAIDALMVINHLNRPGEGESASVYGVAEGERVITEQNDRSYFDVLFTDAALAELVSEELRRKQKRWF